MEYKNIEIKANGVILPPPVSIDLNLEDIDADSERDVKSAILDRNRIRSDVHKLSLAYGLNDLDTVSTVLQAISSATFEVELFDIKANERVTKKMYAGPKSMQFVYANQVWVKALKFNLIEV